MIEKAGRGMLMFFNEGTCSFEMEVEGKIGGVWMGEYSSSDVRWEPGVVASAEPTGRMAAPGIAVTGGNPVPFFCRRNRRGLISPSICFPRTEPT